MKISATQDEMFARCPRQWWLRYVHRLPELVRTNFDFGTVLHSVCERYLLADDTGRDPQTGEPVDLFPQGWDIVEDKAGPRRLDPLDASLIRKLIDKGLEAGILERRPHREVERPLDREVIPGVQFIGFVDCLLPGEIQDHKTTKSTKWAKTPKTLATSLQMLDYAKEAIERDPDLKEVRLRHNVFVKDPERPIVRKVETTVRRSEVEKNWKRLQGVAAQMQALARQATPVEQWREIPGPTQNDACRAYGGCPFLSICGGTEDPSAYRRRVQRAIDGGANDPARHQKPSSWEGVWGSAAPGTTTKGTTKPGTTTMSDIFARRSARQVDASPSSNNGVALSAPAAPTAQAPTDNDTPPWANPNCKACSTNPIPGFNSKGQPCRICDLGAKRAGGLTSSDFIIDEADGFVVWEPREGVNASGGQAELVRSDVEAQARQALPEPARTEPAMNTEEPEQSAGGADDAAGGAPESETSAPDADGSSGSATDEPAAAPAPLLRDEPSPKADAKPPKTEEKPAKKGSRGRPRIGFRLYINCVPIGVDVKPADELFREVAAEMAAENGVDSYFDLNTWDRRAAFQRAAHTFPDRFGRMHIAARTGDPDVWAFVTALRSVACERGDVVEGLAG